jgi:carboxyl-terminal processing protease
LKEEKKPAIELEIREAYLEVREEFEKKTERKSRKLLNRCLYISFTILFVGVGFWAGLKIGESRNSSNAKGNSPLSQVVILNQDGSKDKSLDFSLFWKVWDLLKEKYVDASKLDEKKLFYGAIKGMLAATGDPYTNFFDPEENKRFNEEITGSFEGIGAELGIKNGILTVIAPLENSPAQIAGLRAGDKIIKINGKDTADMILEDAVDQIRGTKGTEVTLTIFRTGEENTEDIKVQRDVINVKSVNLEFKEDNIAYIKISRFGDDTDSGFSSIASKVASQNPKGIIIDLRNDPGGYLDKAVDVASKMIPKSKTVVIEENSSGNQNKLNTYGGDILSNFKTIVLINEGSASAAEILAGALREDRDNVTLEGKTSFGKGSVQEFMKLPQGTAAKITVAKWLTPNGNQINNVGIKPDVEVDLTNDDYQNNRDPQLDKALELLK